MSKFCSTYNKGFHLVFSNGCTLSVQWGAGNYCDRYYEPFASEAGMKFVESKDAEIAIFDSKDNLITLVGMGDSVAGYLSVSNVASVISVLNILQNEDMVRQYDWSRVLS